MASFSYRIEGYEQFEALFPSSLEWVRNDLRGAFERAGQFAVDVLFEESRLNPDRPHTQAHASGLLSESFTTNTDLLSSGVIRMTVANNVPYESAVREGSHLPSGFPDVRRAGLGGVSILDWVQIRGLDAPRGPEQAAFLVARAIFNGLSESYGPHGRVPNRYDLRSAADIVSYTRRQITNAARSFEIIGVSPQFSTRFQRQRVQRVSDVVRGSRDPSFVNIPRNFPADPIGTFRRNRGGRLVPGAV